MSNQEDFEHIRQIAWDAVGTDIETEDKALVKIHEFAKKQAAQAPASSEKTDNTATLYHALERIEELERELERAQAPASGEAVAIINRVVSELNVGFVACRRCGDQEDTATLDCMSDLKKLQSILTTSAVPEWVKCSERLPTEDDADVNGHVWTHDKAFRQPRYAQCLFLWSAVKDVADITHWMPTGLKRPQPPKQEN